jgi:hypothetical protein
VIRPESDQRPRPTTEGATIVNDDTTYTATVTVPTDNTDDVTVPAVYEACDVSGTVKVRSRATRAEMAARNDAIYEIVRAAQPTGIRFTYYRATVKGIVPKTDNGYVKVQRAVLAMRREGRIPWHWITDTNRWMRKPTSYGSVEEAIADIGASYRRAMWRDSPVAVEVWCESESVAGVLYPITAHYDVPLYPIKGQTSDSFAYGAARGYRDDPRRLVIIYVGDHDPAGYEIETNLHAKLIEHSGRRDIEFSRLACDADDVQRLELTGTPPKKTSYVDATTGERVSWVGPAVEIEAIDPPILRSWLEQWITEFIDPDAMRLHRIAEDNERDVLLRMAGGVQ